MGRLEALIVAALGRSPYDEQLFVPQNPEENSGVVSTGQRYDDRGHPVSYETRQRMRDHVRASNEVMQAAGIIEETADVQARDKVVEDSLNKEMEIGLKRFEIGRVVLVAGVWGVCGLRKRILLYKSYSAPFLDLIRTERGKYSVIHMIGAGTPTVAIYQTFEWISYAVRALLIGPYGEGAVTGDRIQDYSVWIFRKLLGYGFTYIMIHYRMFAILQQLNLIFSTRLFPSLRSFIPFSAFSPIQLSTHPDNFAPATLFSWISAFTDSVTPIGLVWIYSMVNSIVSSITYNLIYSRLREPYGIKERVILHNSQSDALFDAQEHPVSPPGRETSQPSSPGLPNQTLADSGGSNAPTQHEATLEALEGRQTHRDDSSDEEDHEISQQTLITFDVEATELSADVVGSWSAELRSANEPPPREPAYQITALTMLPMFLATEGLTAVVSSFVMLPIESLMVRTVAKAYRRSAGIGTGDMYSGLTITWGSIGNILVAQGIQMVVTGVIWAALVVGSQVTSGKPMIWRRKDDVNKE